ncbi:MAG: LPS export ABC transporter permease LptF [Pseudomonadota bacterium]
MMLFDSTLRRELARSFGATLVVILTIVLTMFLIRTLGQAALGRVSPQDVVLLLGYTSLGHLPTMLALSLFISVVATLGRMYRDSEMTIWFASGVGLRRFVRPVLQMAWPVLLVVGLLALGVWPWVNRQSEELKSRYQGRSDLARVAPGQFQTSNDGRRVFFIDRESETDQVGRNVFILSRVGDIESVVTARSGRIETRGTDQLLVLDRGQRNEENLGTGEKSLAQFETYRVVIGERVIDNSGNVPAKARNTLELLANPSVVHQGELSWRLGLLLGAANLTLLGLGLANTSPRRPNNWNLLFALLSFVVYYNMINLTQAWVAASKLSMGTAMALSHGGALALALALIWWRDNGTVRRMGWSARPRSASPSRRSAAPARARTPASTPGSPSPASPTRRKK